MADTCIWTTEGLAAIADGRIAAAVTGDDFMIAAYVAAAALDADTDAYTVTDEVADGLGYSAGGVAMTGAALVENGGEEIVDFDDPVWPLASFTARKFLVYLNTAGNKAVALITYDADKTGTGGNFTLTMPAATAGNGFLRLTQP